MSLVREFHEAFSLPAPEAPVLLPEPDVVRLRARLIREEFEEVMAELARLTRVDGPDHALRIMRDLLKELSDLRYVVEGCAVTFGLPHEAAYIEVHRSNMSKLGEDGRPIHREDGKVLKGPGYAQADMEALLPDPIEVEVFDA